MTDSQAEDESNLWQRLKVFFGVDGDDAQEERAENLAKVLQEHLHEDDNDAAIDAQAAIAELSLIKNILQLTRLTAEDVMIPRADIIGIEAGTPAEDVQKIFAWTTHSRLPVYRETLDDIVGILDLKDIAGALARREPLQIARLMKAPLIVAPSRAAMTLLVEMRAQKHHVALIVDEYGGIDGMVTQSHLIEAIVGDIDGNGQNAAPPLDAQKDGTIIVDARLPIRDFEEIYGDQFPEHEHEDIDTMGGLAMSLAGKMPLRGELLKHEVSGLTIEVLKADPRRVKQLRVHGLSLAASS